MANSKKQQLMEQISADPVWKAGYTTGFERCRVDVLSHLEKKYMADDAPDRGTPEAQAILSLARELSELMKL